MADAVTSQTLQDGDKSVVMKFTNISDGSGEADVEQTESPVFVPRTPLLKQICGRIVTTVKATRSPDFRMRFTTVS